MTSEMLPSTHAPRGVPVRSTVIEARDEWRLLPPLTRQLRDGELEELNVRIRKRYPVPEFRESRIDLSNKIRQPR